MMGLDELHELAPATVAAVRLFYGGNQNVPVSVRESDLARFVTGLATHAERDATTAALIESRVMRERLVAMHRELNVAGEAVPGPGMTPALAKCLAEGLRDSLAFYTKMRAWCLANTWAAISHGESNEGISARSALAAAGRTLHGILASPRFAVVRGTGEAPQLEGYLPSGIEMDFEAKLDADGALQAQISFREQVPGAAQAIMGRLVVIELLDPSGGSIPIAGESLSSLEWQIEAPEFGQVSGLTPGLLPSSLFRVSFGNAQPLPSRRNHLFADCPSVTGPVALTILDEPRIHGGDLTVTLEAQASVRQMLAGHRIDFLVPVGSVLLLLGSWPMAAWGDDAHTFRMPVPGVEDGSFETGSILQARLVRTSDEAS